MPHPKVKISDDSGNTASVTGNRLDVNAAITIASDDINIGNVVLQTDGGLDISASMAVSDSIPNLDGDILLGTHALLYARSDASTTVGITCEDSTHNALHVAISDGAGIANVDGNNALLVDVVAGGVLESAVDGIETLLGTIDSDTGNLVDLGGCIGTDGITGPSKVLSIGGTTGLGNIEEILVDSSGHLQIDVLTAPSTAVTNAGTFAVQAQDGSGTALTSNSGKLDVCLHSEDGTAITETGGFLNVSIRSGSAISTIGSTAPNYVWSMGMEYADFDGSALPFDNDIDTEGNSTPFQGSKYGIQYIMPVNEDGSKSPVDQTSGQMITTHGITGMVSDMDADVGTTAEKIHTASDVAIKRIDIQANRSNTGYIYVGDGGVAGDGTGGGIALAAGDFYSLDIDNTGDVYVAASVADEDVTYIYYT